MPRTQSVTGRIGTIVGLMVACLLFNSRMSHCVGMQAQLGDPARVSVDDTVQQLVRQLASPDYAKRAVATSKLLELGERAIPALEQAQQAGDLDLAMRAAELIELSRATRDPAMSDSDAERMREFQAASSKDRTSRFQQLISDGNFPLVLMIARNYPAQRTDLFASSARRLNSMLFDALAGGNWSQVERTLADPIVLEHSPADVYHYHRSIGSLTELLDGHLSEMRGPQPQLNLGRLQALLAVLRMEGRFDDAAKLLPLIQEEPLREQYRQQIWFESGSWKTLLGKLVTPDQKQPGDGQVMANPSQRALLQFLAEDIDGVAATVAELQQALRQAEEQQQEFAIESLRGQLLMVGLVTLDWDLASQYLNRDDRFNTFNFLIGLHRYREAFELIGLGRTASERRRWVRESLEELKRLAAQIEETDATQRRTREYRDLISQLSLTRELIVDVADQLATLGLDTEAELYLQMLVVAEPERIQTRESALALLLAHERHDAAWQLIELCLSQQRASDLVQQLFRGRFAGINGFYTTISSRYGDPLTQIKMVSGLVNSPLGTSSKFDLEQELARYRSSVPLTTSGQVELMLGQLYELHGQNELSRYWLDQSSRMGSTSAGMMLAKDAFFQEDYSLVTDYFEPYWRQRRAVAEALMTASALEKQSRKQADSVAAEQVLNRAKRTRYGALVAWRSRSIGLTSVIASVDDMRIADEITWLLKSHVFALGQPSLTSENYRGYLAANLRSKQTERYQEAVIQSSIKLFNDLAVNNVAAKPLEQWVEDAKWLLLARAHDKIQQGRFEDGVRDGLTCIAFAPGDSSVSESLFESLIATGANESIDGLLEGSSKFYRAMLAEYPDSPLHRNNYAWTRICARRNLELARRHIEIALARRPHNPSYLDTMAELEFLSGDVQQALRLNQQCIQNNPFRRFYRLQQQKFLKALGK